MQPRFILQSELKYKKMFADGIEIYIYPSSKEEREAINSLIQNAIAKNEQLSKKHIKDVIGENYSAGFTKWLIIIKVAEDDS